MDRPKSGISRLVDQNFGMEITPQDLILPFSNFHGANYFRPWKLYNESSTKDYGSTIENTKENFKITLDIQHFRPQEINVKVVNNEIIIEGNHDDRQDDHGYISRQFVRRYCMLEDCSSETVTSTLSSDGVLTIIASKIAKDTKVKEKIVPITMCESSPKPKSVSVTKNEVEFNKQQSELKLNEDHCRLLKPELFKDSISATDKSLSESREELKLISSEKSEQAKIRVTSEKLKDALGQCKTAIAELTDKFDETSGASSQMSSMKSSMMSEKKEKIKTVSETKPKSVSDTKNEIEFDKQQSEFTLKDHCRLLKPESFKDVISGTEKLLSESRKETDELLKLISSEKSEQAKIRVTSEKLEDALAQCKTAVAELTDKFDEKSEASSQMKSSVMSESFESQESSSSMSKSSVASCTKAASEKTSEFSEIICTQLK